jgi:hypothetical protein
MAQPNERLPFLMEWKGEVVHATTEAAGSEVQLSGEQGHITASATAEQVQWALRLRQEPVRALLLMGPKVRLLWLRPLSAALLALTPELRQHYIFERWDEVLRRLAR